MKQSYCDVCKTILPPEDLTHTSDNKLVCDGCLDEEYTLCEYCGEYIPNDEITITGDNSQVCCECLDRHYRRCFACEEYCCKDIMAHDSQGDWLCESCQENYVLCADCGYWTHIDYTYFTEDRALCENCAYEYPQCENCRAILDNTDQECWNCGWSPIIHEYNFKPEPVFYGNKDNPYLGIELEVECPNCAQLVAEEIRNDFLYCKHDGSLNYGFEIVSHPGTLKFHQNYHWKDILETLMERGCKSHDTSTCGLHIHISRKDLSRIDEIKIALLVDEYPDFWKRIARRWDNSYAKAVKKKLKDYNNNYDRYEMVNFQNKETIEFRLFRGTLKYETFMARIESVHALYSFVKNETISISYIINHKNDTLDKFKSFIVKNYKQYSYLYKYLLDRNMI